MPDFRFLDADLHLPSLSSHDDAERGLSSLAARMRLAEHAPLAPRIDAILAHPPGKALLETLFTYSPFLSRLVLNDTAFFAEICEKGPDACLEEIKSMLAEPPEAAAPQLMQTLRIAKARSSLLIACADIAGLWPLEQVTLAMSDIAELCVQRTVAFLLTQAQAKGEIALPDPARPQIGSGLIVLAMGKLGARELNYSSDIDLIVLFDREVADYTGSHSIERFFPRLAQEMVRLLQERTREGYGFRVDLRLRPDPASTPVALSTAGAVTYYETVGQNWERAALIKARPIAGDLDAGFRFLRQIAPFIWRKHLDFAAIADIQSIKRQMDARTGAVIAIPGHNVKTGLGGIREIEFFAQIHQLIWGGREPRLRIAGTCATLETLAELTLITPGLAGKLTESYRFLRTVEHRLQMENDQQTHSLPMPEEARTKLAGFMGFGDVRPPLTPPASGRGRQPCHPSPRLRGESEGGSALAQFETALFECLTFVHTNFAESFRGQGDLGSEEGNLSFTGVENDPQTIETLNKMGYRNPASVSEIIQGWHRGTRRATRTKRARELITELTPTLLKALGGTSNPDQAFIRFDEFLTHLPAGVQLFSLFAANPQLLDLIALIMGSAPALAEALAKNSSLLDTVLTTDFYRDLPDKPALFDELSGRLVLARDYEDEMDIIRRFKNEKQFQSGIQLMRRQVSAADAGHYLSDIADTCIEALMHRVERVMSARRECGSGRLAAVALGRLGARELTFGSDIDLVFVYDADQHDLFNKLAQRFIGAVTALTREGRLYEVDTRLRPSGRDGMLAVTAGTLDKYMRESAWTFELMAFTRARVITGSPEFKNEVTEIIRRNLAVRRDAAKLKADILSLREKITREHGSDNPWNLKYAHGGLMDLDFLAQYHVLLHAHADPSLAGLASSGVFFQLMKHETLDAETGMQLLDAHKFLTSLFTLLRLCAVGIPQEAHVPSGLKTLLAGGLGFADFTQVKEKLLSILALVRRHFSVLIG